MKNCFLVRLMTHLVCKLWKEDFSLKLFEKEYGIYVHTSRTFWEICCPAKRCIRGKPNRVIWNADVWSAFRIRCVQMVVPAWFVRPLTDSVLPTASVIACLDGWRWRNILLDRIYAPDYRIFLHFTPYLLLLKPLHE